MTAITEHEPMTGVPSRLARMRDRALALVLNPLLVRDLRSTLRGRRPLWLQIGYTLVLVAALAISAYACYEERSMRTNMGMYPDASYGQYMFVAMYEVQLALLALVVVAYSAGAIALEYEKRTYDMLAVTTLSTLEIVLGKVASITALCWMLLLTSVPLAMICLLLGGVSPGQILLSYLLLASTIPLWAAIGVLLSVLTSRTIGSYVATLLSVSGWLFVASLFSGAGGPDLPFLGALSPIVAPLPDLLEPFQLFRHHLPAWIPALVLNGLLTAAVMVAAAEAMPLHLPKRSTLLRGLLLAFVFCSLFVATAAVIQNTASASASPSYGGGGTLALAQQFGFGTGAAEPPLWGFVRNMLFVSLLLALVTVPVFSTYLPPAEDRARLAAWVLGPISPRRWLRRDANVGWRSSLLFLFVACGAVVLPALLADRMRLLALPTFSTYRTALLAYSLVLYGLALTGYSLLAVAFTAWWRDRRVGALLAVLVMLALNVEGVYYTFSPYDFQRAQFLAHPVLALTSPVPAVQAVLDPNHRSPYWTEEWGNAAYVIGLAFLYQALLVLGSVLVLRRVSRERPAEAPVS